MVDEKNVCCAVIGRRKRRFCAITRSRYTCLAHVRMYIVESQQRDLRSERTREGEKKEFYPCGQCILVSCKVSPSYRAGIFIPFSFAGCLSSSSTFSLFLLLLAVFFFRKRQSLIYTRLCIAHGSEAFAFTLLDRLRFPSCVCAPYVCYTYTRAPSQLVHTRPYVPLCIYRNVIQKDSRRTKIIVPKQKRYSIVKTVKSRFS